MPSEAMTLASDSPNQATWSASERPPLDITTKGRLALVPSLDELSRRRGTKGLQACLDDLSHAHFMKHGHDWIYTKGVIKLDRARYFVHFDSGLTAGDVHYLGDYRQALGYLLHYATTGRRNDAMRRAR